MLSDVWFRLRAIFRRNAVEDELEDELRFHHDRETEKNMKAGMGHEEAARQARLKFGGLEQIKEECRDARGVNLLASGLQDLRYGARTMAKARGFTLVAIITLALGIGANTAMFSVVNTVLLRPLPYRDAKSLVELGGYDMRRPGSGVAQGTVSYPNIMDVRERNRSFEDVGLYTDAEYTLTGAGDPLHVKSEVVSADMFRLLGAQPWLGRNFLPPEDAPGHHVVLLSDRFWRAHFNGDPGVIGRAIALNGRSYTIVGVMGRGFQFPIDAAARDLWVTFSRMGESDSKDPKDLPRTAQRGNDSYNALARLKPGVTVAQANADLAGIARALAAEYPDNDAHMGISASGLLDFVIGDTRTPLLLLLVAVGVVLLIACANVANLLLARATGRGREIAIRDALGATRRRIVRQLVTESVLLSGAGAVLGVGFAYGALAGVLRLYPDTLPRVQEVSIDYRVLLFTVALALVTAIMFGVLPAWHASSPNPNGAMREGGRTASASARQNRVRSGLVIAETAVGVMLLICAGLLIRSLNRLAHADLGFDPAHVLTATFDLSDTRYNPDQMDRFVGDLVKRLNALPGVVRAAGALPLPLHNDGWMISFNLLERPAPKAEQPSAGFYNVTPGLFETLNIPLLRGRTFGEQDQRNGPPVMIINAAFARKYFPHENPIGQRVEIGAGEGPARAAYKTREIIGIVGDVRRENLRKEPIPAYYVPLSQLMWGAPVLVIRTAGDPQAVVPEVRKVLASMDPEAPLYDVRTMNEYLALDLGRARFQTVLLALFAGIALLLTAVGLYGVMAYAVVQRAQEIGVRMALGASRGEVLRMILQRGALLSLSGLAVGVLGALAIARLIQSLLYEIPPRDPITYLAVCVTLGAVGLVASYIPALRATRVDPIIALRYE